MAKPSFDFMSSNFTGCTFHFAPGSNVSFEPGNVVDVRAEEAGPEAAEEQVPGGAETPGPQGGPRTVFNFASVDDLKYMVGVGVQPVGQVPAKNVFIHHGPVSFGSNSTIYAPPGTPATVYGPGSRVVFK
jgi:hypothetical protein